MRIQEDDKGIPTAEMDWLRKIAGVQRRKIRNDETRQLFIQTAKTPVVWTGRKNYSN